MDRKTALILILIFITAASLRLYGLSRGDALSDEVLYAFRAIGMLDFDEGADQTTPLEWFDPSAGRGQVLIPSWTKLSFHDHPPLVFLVQHVSIKLLGETNFAFRFPSALFGLATIWFVYLIGIHLYSKRVGLIAAAILAVTFNHVFISRTGLQEAYVLFFLATTSYFFIKSLKKDSHLITTGIFLGLAFLTKYTTFILVPIFLACLLINRRDYFKNKKLWLGAFFAILIFSPVIIYNINLYRAVGHFDFQLSSLTGNPPEVWKIQPGKEIGTLADRFKNYLPGLLGGNSWIFLGAFALAFFASIRPFLKNPKETLLKNYFLLIAISFLALFMLAIGPSFRFLSMLTPFLALAVAVFFDAIYTKISGAGSIWKITAGTLFGLFLLFETAYSVNSQILYYPKGPKLWTWSEIRYDNYNWGYNNLADYLSGELAGKMPALAFAQKYNFVEKIHEKALARAEAAGLKPYPALIVYDGNLQTAAQLWTLDRLQIYHAWPVIKTETYLQFLKENGVDYFERSGFAYFYFIRYVPGKVPLKRAEKLTAAGELFEENLKAVGKTPIAIKNARGDEVFRIYKFTF